MKRLLWVIVFLLGLFVWASPVFAEEIIRYDETIQIRTDGTIGVQEVIGYDFEKEYRHGIFRTIPTHKTNEEGKRFQLEFTDFSVNDAKEQTYPYTQTDSEGTINLKIGDPDKTITGKHSYNISYTVAGALTYFSEHDELYWNVTGDKWDVPIDEAVVRIELPPGVTEENIRFDCFTGIFGSDENNCEGNYVANTNTLTVVTTKPLSSYEGLTVVVGFPKGLVATLEPKEYIPFWETTWGKIVIAFLIVLAVLWYIIAPLSLPYFWWRYGRDPKPPMGEATAWFEAPRGKEGRLLTPGETGVLIDERADNADITATIVDLARRGYLKIIEKTKGSIQLKKEKSKVAGEILQPFEKVLLDGIFASEDVMELKTASLVKTVTDVKNKLYESVVDEGFFPKNPQSVRNAFTIGSVLSLMTGNFLLFLSMLLFGYHMPRKSIVGAGAAARARSLKNFITSQERQFKFQAEKQMLFEKMLPFAIAFGVEKIWIARFAQMHLARPTWYQGYAAGRFNAIAFAHSLNSASTSVSKAATSVSSSTGHSSGFSGGSSGGGGGGGGGGSW